MTRNPPKTPKTRRLGLALLLATLLVASSAPAVAAKDDPLDARVEVGLLCPLDLEAHVRVDGSVLLTFDPNGDVNGTRVYRAEGNGAPAKVADLDPGTRSYVDRGVGPGTYVYEVRALVDVDVLLSCPRVIVTVPGGDGEHPRCPTGLVAVVNLNGTVLLDLDLAAEATATVLQRGTGGGDPEHLASLDAGVTAFLDVDVILGNTYTYLVFIHVGLELLLCLVVEVAIPGDDGDGLCPTILRAILRVDGTILLLFDAALDVESATLLRAEGTGDPRPLAELEVGATAYLDVDVLLGLTYRYILLVVVGGVELLCPGPEVPVEEDPCPTGLTARARGDGDVRVTFDPHPNATAHRVYRAEGDGDPGMVAELGPDATEYLDEDTVPGTTYTYEVRSVFGDMEAEGCPTVEVTAVPVFPSAALGIAAPLAGVVAYAGLRRRS